MANPPTTNTLTAGTVGAFTVAGLPAGGTLTLTFSKPGFADTTVPVQPGGTPLTVTMSDSLGRISGSVVDPSGAAIAGATVTATDGKRTWPVTSSSASAGSAAGSYVIAGLPVGQYTLTAKGPTTLARTSLVTVTAGGRPRPTSPCRRIRPPSPGRGADHAGVRDARPGRARRRRCGRSRPGRPVGPVDGSVDGTVEVLITVHNTGTLIGGYQLRVLGADPSWVSLQTDTLSLFPDESQTVTATVAVPAGVAAGERRMAVQVREVTPPHDIAINELELLVPAAEELAVQLTPMTVVAGGHGMFGVLLHNTGNTTVTSELAGRDAEDAMWFEFDPPVVTLAPGDQAIADLKAAGPRRWFGQPVVRAFDVLLIPPGSGRAPGAPAPGLVADRAAAEEDQAAEGAAARRRRRGTAGGAEDPGRAQGARRADDPRGQGAGPAGGRGPTVPTVAPPKLPTELAVPTGRGAGPGPG